MRQGFKRNINNRVIYYSIPSFDETGMVLSAFSTIHGGVSSGKQSTMNLGFYSDKSMANVRENFKIFGEAVGFKTKQVVITSQIHGDYIYEPIKDDAGKMINSDEKLKVADGLITSHKNFVLAKLFADCVPIYLYDSRKKVISLIHAGWRGTQKEIVKKGITKMISKYGCDAADILAGIGPSIGPCCFEVDKPVAEVFSSFNRCVKEKGNGKYNVDLWRANYLQMLCAGLKDDNITMSNLCTYCNEDFFSYRREKGQTGRMVAFLKLR